MEYSEGGLTSLVIYFWNPEPFGTEFNTVECFITGDFIFTEIQIGKSGMNNIKYHLQTWEMPEFTKIMTTTTNKIGQRDMKGATNDYFLFDSCFSSNKFVESAMNVDADMIGVVKTNTKVFHKETIENITNNWPGDS